VTDVIKITGLAPSGVLNGTERVPVVKGGQTVQTTSLQIAMLAPGDQSNIAVGVTGVLTGTAARVLYDNAGVLGEYPISGSGSVVMTNGATLVAPALGTPASGDLSNCTMPSSAVAFLQAGTGAVARTAQAKEREWVSVLDFGAVPDGGVGTGTDNTAPFQLCIDYCQANGKTMWIPDGGYYFDPDSAALDPGLGGFAIIGQSRQNTILYYDEGNGPIGFGSKSLFANFVNTAKGTLQFESFQVQGTLAGNPGQRGYTAFGLWYYEAITLRNLWFNQIACFATDVQFLQRFECSGSWFTDVSRDGCRGRDCNNVLVDNNFFFRTGDHSIAIHTSHAQPITESVLITNNQLINTSQIVCAGGGRKTIISNNICRLCSVIPIWVLDLNTGGEGRHSFFDLSIEDNSITDSVWYLTGSGMQPAAAGIRVDMPDPLGAAATNNVAPGRYNSTTGEFVYPWDWYDAYATSGVVTPSCRISIKNNRIGRSEPAVAAYADYGFGEIIVLGTSYDPPVTDADLRPSTGIGVSLCGGVNVEISGNQVEHTVTAISMTAPATNYDYIANKVHHNTLFDFTSIGIALASGAFHADVAIEDNILEGDYYRQSSNSNMNGTYDVIGTPTGISLGSCTGVIVARNTLASVCNPLSAASSNIIVKDNLLRSGLPAALGFNAANTGIGTAVTGYGQWRYQIEDADPTSATYRQVTSEMVLNAAAMPASGWYYQGWIVWDSAPSNANGRLGWMRLTTGTGHTLNTDWVEIGMLLGPNTTPATIGTGVKTVSNAADSSTNFGHYLSLTLNGTVYYLPCSAVAPT
jgi:hypothetical protein